MHNRVDMRTRSLAPFLVVVAPLFAGCSSDSKPAPSTSASAWTGKTYLLNIPDTRWKKPGGEAGAEVGRFVPKMLFSLESASGGVDVLLGTSDVNGKQNMCSP